MLILLIYMIDFDDHLSWSLNDHDNECLSLILILMIICEIGGTISVSFRQIALISTKGLWYWRAERDESKWAESPNTSAVSTLVGWTVPAHSQWSFTDSSLECMGWMIRSQKIVSIEKQSKDWVILLGDVFRSSQNHHLGQTLKKCKILAYR